MPELNASIPRFRCLVRAEFLYGLDPARAGQFILGTAHGITTIENRALGFHVLLDNGAHISRLPIHALVTNEDAPRIPVDEPWRCQLWDCMSYHCAVIEYDWLAEVRCKVVLADKTIKAGTYLFSVDYYNSATSEDAGESGWKNHHVIETDDGLIVAQPNNRVAWFEPSAVVPFDKPPDYIVMPRTWKVEDGAKWRTEDSKRMFYETEVVA